MSLQIIQQYYNEVERKIRYGGSRNEESIRTAFQRVLEHYSIAKNLELVPELYYRTKYNDTVKPDGTLKDALRESWGYWESKDEYDSLDEEIIKKLAKGYPTNNILFEDSQTAVLIQNGKEVDRVAVENSQALHGLLMLFVNFEPREVREFHEAIENFKEDLPDLLITLREEIARQAKSNPKFAQARADFLELCHKSINPHLVMDDVREMIIQHILTEEIFITVFEESQYHRENNIAHQLEQIVNTFFKGTIKRNILGKIDQYYRIIKARAAQIANHHEKQKFLKVLYENFYKAYNPKGADRLGIVYTPNEIVRFMIESAEYLTDKHFGKLLSDKNVHILDPATGTGTFITELIEYLPAHLLAYKYQHEIHCNEVAILPYYIANLNIEYSYAQKMGHYAEFENICFVDTLDNLGFGFEGKQYTMEMGLTPENIERINRQNTAEISVIIGNPPYNANQMNENENNKNRPYPGVDKRIKATYIKQSTAQKTKLYDMYTRFIRWASDRLGDNGVVAFVTNRSFLEARSFDGFRKCIQDEFDYAYIIDLGGDIRTLSGKDGIFLDEKHTIFGAGAAVGIAMSFFVKKKTEHKLPCKISYIHPCDIRATRDEKIAFLQSHKFQNIPFEHIRPNKNHNWINLVENDWDDLLPVATKQTKFAKKQAEVDAIFDLYSLGVATNRDEWVYDFDKDNLAEKMRFFIEIYNQQVTELSHHTTKTAINNLLDYRIKWSRDLKNELLKKRAITYNNKKTKLSLYRPFVKKYFYTEPILNDVLTQNHFKMFGSVLAGENKAICFSRGQRRSFAILGVKLIPNLDIFIPDATQCLPLYRYDKEGNRHDNITDYGLAQFRARYGAGKSSEVSKTSELSKLDIFHYVYAVLHNPAYRQKYELNLKREFPHIPFYDDFWQWVEWGRQLMELHINYETVAPHPLKRVDRPLGSKSWQSKGEAITKPERYKATLKADKEANLIKLDNETTLRDVPPVAWQYMLGNRSALEWVLDRYKERKPRDPTIRDKFNNYRFSDYKESVIELLGRVCTVSVETMRIIEAMEQRK
ncbi:N-6 DNA methylase [Anaerolineales bacterium HSG25]|nr:N-6 DNA methylase [Anaerolineales bacterium HSG25]